MLVFSIPTKVTLHIVNKAFEDGKQCFHAISLPAALPFIFFLLQRFFKGKYNGIFVINSTP